MVNTFTLFGARDGQTLKRQQSPKFRNLTKQEEKNMYPWAKGDKNLSIFDYIKSVMRQNIPERAAKGKGKGKDEGKGKGKSKQKHRGIFDVWSFR